VHHCNSWRIKDQLNVTYYLFHFLCANLTKPSTDHNSPPHNKWGIYQLTCNTCNLWYVGQTSLSLNIRFQEHIRCIRNNNPQSAYAQHILQNQHEYDQMNSTMIFLKPLNNPSLFNPYEQYYIKTLYREGKLIPEQSPGEINPLFQTVINPQPPTFHMNRPVVLQPATRIRLQPNHTETPTHIEPRYVQSQIHNNIVY